MDMAADGGPDEGDRMNVDDSDPQPFDLRPLAPGQAVPVAQAPAQPSASSPNPAPAAASVPPAAQAASTARTVNGVNNLTTGE